MLHRIRAARRDIKTVMLLAQALAKKQAKSKGYHEVWLVEDGFVTEGGSSTAFIITNDNVLVTRPNSHAILPAVRVVRRDQDRGRTAPPH